MSQQSPLPAARGMRRAPGDLYELAEPPGNPRLAGLVFADLGWAGDTGLGSDATVKAGVGYGLRVRVPWLDRIGIDVGVPLSPSPFDESFHLNLSLGWTY